MAEPAYVARLEKSIERATNNSLDALARFGQGNVEANDRLALEVSKMVTALGEVAKLIEVQSVAMQGRASNGNGSEKRNQSWREGLLLIVAVIGIGFSFYQILSGQIGWLSQRVETAEAKASVGMRDLRGEHDMVHKRLEEIARVQSQSVKALEEIETQFCAASMVRNLQIQGLERMLGMLWPKHLPPFQASDYWPSIGRNCASAD